MEDREYELRIAELKQRKWEAEYQAKGDMEGQGYKGIILVNGGAAVALGAFLQALVGKPEAAPLLPFILTGVAFHIAGVFFGSVIFWFRYMQGLYEKAHNKYLQENPWWAWRWYLAATSLLCFIVGMGVVVCGGFSRLSFDPPSPPAKIASSSPSSNPCPQPPSNISVNADARERASVQGGAK